jgi:hypothetical protein
MVALLESRVVLLAGMFLEPEKVWHHKLEHAWSWSLEYDGVMTVGFF